MTIDFVYRLSPQPSDFDELRYSLRSFHTNTQIERVHFFGGKPKWLLTGLHHSTKQVGDKLRNARTQMRAVVECDEVSDPFWSIDDDFFLLEPSRQIPLWHGGPFDQWLRDLGPRFKNTPYMKNAQATIRMLMMLRPSPSLSWSLHTPILVFKPVMRQALEIDAEHCQDLHLRTLYGNLAHLESLTSIKAERCPAHDVKGHLAPKPGQVYASTANATWQTGKLGKHIRAKFAEPSPWEKL